MSSEEGSVVDFIPLKGFENDYEILNEYPYTIRKKSNKRALSESLNKVGGYIRVNLNGKLYLKHRLIALQFLPNGDPINNDVIDHINRNRTDNHLHNLRWCSSSVNSKNKSSNNGIQYEFIDNIPDESMVVDFYDTRNNHHEFEFYYFYNDVFYFFNGINYRILHVNYNKSGNACVSMRDTNNRKISVYINRFKQQHDLI